MRRNVGETSEEEVQGALLVVPPAHSLEWLDLGQSTHILLCGESIGGRGGALGGPSGAAGGGGGNARCLHICLVGYLSTDADAWRRPYCVCGVFRGARGFASLSIHGNLHISFFSGLPRVTAKSYPMPWDKKPRRLEPAWSRHSYLRPASLPWPSACIKPIASSAFCSLPRPFFCQRMPLLWPLTSAFLNVLVP